MDKLADLSFSLRFKAMRFRMKRLLFDAFSPIVHIKLPESADENGGFRKRFRKWSGKKPAPFLVWIGEKAAFENGDEKKRHFQLVWAIGEDDSVWTGKNKTKTLVWSKIFGFVYFEMKMDTTVNGA